MKHCAICRKEAHHDFVGEALFCPDCAKIWASAKTNARLVVALDHDIESDERLKACKLALEAAREQIKALMARIDELNGY